MAKFHVKPDSVTVIGKEKIGMEVKFISADAETDFMYHEIEGVEKDVVESQLQVTADEWEKSLTVPEVQAPNIETGKDVSVTIKD